MLGGHGVDGEAVAGTQRVSSLDSEGARPVGFYVGGTVPMLLVQLRHMSVEQAVQLPFEYVDTGVDR